MALPRWLTPAAGVLASITTTAVLIILVMLIVSETHAQTLIWVAAVVAAALNVLSLGLLLVSTMQHSRLFAGGPSRTLLFITAASCLCSASITIAALAWLCARLVDLPPTMAGAPTNIILYTAYILCALFIVTACLYLIGSLRYARSHSQAQSLYTNEERHGSSEMREGSSSGMDGNSPRSYEFPSSSQPFPDWMGKFPVTDDAGSKHLASKHFVRPISSKTRLVSKKLSYRSPSLDSTTSQPDQLIADAFDTWDVDPNSNTMVTTFSFPNPPPSSSKASSPHLSSKGGFLETIPASPTDSRSPSPGYPLDLEPPRMLIKRTRSHSPVNSMHSSMRRHTQGQSPMTESNIHPLFRTDSPEPPPSATPGTNVTAAPGAGHLISDRSSVSRMRSGSLPTTPSPLVNSSNSPREPGITTLLEHRISSTESETELPTPPEREMTPPIPEWILGAGARASGGTYAKRKASNAAALAAERRGDV